MMYGTGCVSPRRDLLLPLNPIYWARLAVAESLILSPIISLTTWRNNLCHNARSQNQRETLWSLPDRLDSIRPVMDMINLTGWRSILLYSSDSNKGNQIDGQNFGYLNIAQELVEKERKQRAICLA